MLRQFAIVSSIYVTTPRYNQVHLFLPHGMLSKSEHYLVLGGARDFRSQEELYTKCFLKVWNHKILKDNNAVLDSMAITINTLKCNGNYAANLEMNNSTMCTLK